MINFSIMLKNKHTIDSLIKGVLVHKTNCLFTNVTWHRNARNIKADRILKNYFNIRAQMPISQTLNLIDRIKSVKVTKSFFNDQRWIHLNTTLQKNLQKLSNQNKMQILHTFTKIKCYNDLFQAVIMKLVDQLPVLQPNEKAQIIYFMAKSQKAKPQIFLKVSDSLLSSLNSQQIKLSYDSVSNIKYIKQNQNNEQQQDQQQAQSLFNQIPGHYQYQNSSNLTIDCRLLILALWSLQKLKIRDNLLSDCIVKKYLKNNLKHIPTNVYPLLMSTLWMSSMENKRIYHFIIRQLRSRTEKQLDQLDRDKAKLLICMLCKPILKPINEAQGHKNEAQIQNKNIQLQIVRKARQQLALFLMQSLMIKHQNNKEYMFSKTAYQILVNASQTAVVDFSIYQKYIKVICQNLEKDIDHKQVVYILDIIRKMRKFNISTNNNHQNKAICQKQFQILQKKMNQDIHIFLNKMKQDHPARKVLRRLVLTNFIQLPMKWKKKIQFQQKQFRKNERTSYSKNSHILKQQHAKKKPQRKNNKNKDKQNKQIKQQRLNQINQNADQI